MLPCMWAPIQVQRHLNQYAHFPEINPYATLCVNLLILTQPILSRRLIMLSRDGITADFLPLL